jgi:ketosteroid isomerase-like protein
MSEENVEIVRAIFDSWTHGDFRAAVSHLDEHVLFVVSRDFPEFGVFVGPEAVAEYTRGFLAQYQQATIEAKDLHPVGDTVLASVVQHSKGRASGIEGDLGYFILFTFRGRKIVRMESLRYEAEALQAAGLSE